MTSRRLQFRGWMRAKDAGDAGQALVETALSVAFLAVLLLGAVEFAQLALVSIEVSNAARAGVQYGAQSGSTANDTTGIQAVASSDASNITLDPTAVSTSYICSDGTASTGANTDCPNSHIEEILTVKTQATYTPRIKIPGFSRPFTLTGQAIQKVAQL
jgi:Flp pilus assembly protein TadG